jgi:hypothetical protein
MSRKDEDRILHGLHYFRETVDEEFLVTGDEILWLAAQSYSAGGRWCRNGELQRFDSSVIPGDLRRKLLLSKFELPLRYLHYRRLVEYTPTDSSAVKIAVTFAGADRAMRLHTRTGRMELWYQERKEGVLGLLITVAVSFITALLAVAVAERLHQDDAEPHRIFYEVDPKSSP